MGIDGCGFRIVQARQAAVADRHRRREAGQAAADQVQLPAVGTEDHRQRPHDPDQLCAGSFIVVGGVRYELVQFHFHHPSEERIAGKSHEMVAHLVHKNAEGKLAVVAVLIDKGGTSELIGTLWKNIPHEKEKEATIDGTRIDVTQLLPKTRIIILFRGR
jgi:hypothetical protein